MLQFPLPVRGAKELVWSWLAIELPDSQTNRQKVEFSELRGKMAGFWLTKRYPPHKLHARILLISFIFPLVFLLLPNRIQIERLKGIWIYLNRTIKLNFHRPPRWNPTAHNGFCLVFTADIAVDFSDI